MADPRPQRSALPWSLWRLVRFVLTRVFSDPVAHGRLRDNGWPAGLRGVAVAWAVLYVVLMAAAVFSTPIRSHTPLVTDSVVTLPTVAIPLLTVAYVFALTCLYVAGLHLVWWLRVPVVLVVVAFLLRQTDFAFIRPVDVVVFVLVGLLLVLTVARWGRAFHWLEFMLALLLIGHGVVTGVILATRDFAGYATDLRLNALFLIAGFAWALAVPAGLVAGAALVELTVRLVAWTVTGVWQELGGERRWSPVWGIAAIVGLVVVRAVQVGWHVWRGNKFYHWTSVLPAMVMFVVVLAACALVVWRADRVHTGDPPVRPDPDDLTAPWSSTSMVLAVLLGVSLGGPLLVGNVLKAFGLRQAGEFVENLGGGWQFHSLVLVAAAVALCAAFVLSGRGRRVVPVILAAAGSWWIVAGLSGVLNLLPSDVGVSLGATLAAFGVFVWLLVRRRLTAVRGMALATVLLLSAVFEYRDILEEPLTATFSLVGVSAAILVGLVWRMLTDSGYSRGDSTRFPRPSRVLVALASTCYAVTSIATVSLVGGQFPYDFETLEASGDLTLGFSLACAAFFTGLSLAARGRLVRPDQPRDDYGRLVPTAGPPHR